MTSMTSTPKFDPARNDAGPVIVFNLTGPAKGKARPRLGRGGVYTPSDTAAYEDRVGWAARSAIYGQAPGWRLNGAYRLVVHVHQAIPASWPKVRQGLAGDGVLLPINTPDLDNVLKIICDGMNKIAWDDDRRVVEMSVRRVYTQGSPFVTVLVQDIKSDLDRW